MNILMIGAEDAILQEVVDFLSGKNQCRIADLPLVIDSSNVLIFPDLEIRINEQNVYHNGIPVPLTHHELFTLLYLERV